MTSEGHPYAVFRRALKNGNLWVAEAVARDLPHISLEDALRLVQLYAEKESPKFEAAARRWLLRYIEESSPRLRDLAEATASLARRETN